MDYLATSVRGAHRMAATRVADGKDLQLGFNATSPHMQRWQAIWDEGILLQVRQVAWRYIKASHQNDPGRTVLELLLVFFVIRTWMQSRTRTEASGRNFVKLSEKEIDELVHDWQPEPLVSDSPGDTYAPPTIIGPPALHCRVQTSKDGSPGHARSGSASSSEKSCINLASTNFAGIIGNEKIKEKALECLRGYGVGSCGPPGFYGQFDTHLILEKSLADFLGVDNSILYAQGFSTVSSVIPTFAKRGDIIVADRGCNFAIQRGIQISRSNVYWYQHNDMEDLERVLKKIQHDIKKSRRGLTRRFIISEGLFEIDGQAADLPKLLELKYAYKYRLILDESWSIGVLGATGRGMTELFDVPGSEVDVIVGSMANGLCSSGGFCAGSMDVVRHQRINSPAVVYSAALPPLLSACATEALYYLTTPVPNANGVPMLPLSTLEDNVIAVRSVLDKLPHIDIPSDPLSPMVHISVRGDLPLPEQSRILQDIVDEALSNGVLLTRAASLPQQEMVVRRPSIRLCISAGLTRKECEKSAAVIKSAINKVLKKR